jgi:adenylylsulfate reductase subunit A
MWYPPFNTGEGLAMGIQAGAEMTTLEMRFIALRCKDTIAPTGTLAQGVGAKQINALGEVYEDKYGITTLQRVYGTVAENRENRGPCALRTVGIAKEQEEDLLKAYLNMAPSQTLRWLESGRGPSVQNVEIEGTEPYITGGHTASGYWVSTNRETTIRGLFAIGDVAGGCPQKYVTGALAEGEIAAKAALRYMNSEISPPNANKTEAVKQKLEVYLSRSVAERSRSTDALEEAMQTIMDKYAGGISTYYSFTEKSLNIADEKILELKKQSEQLSASNMQELVYIMELQERLILCRSVIAHLAAQKESNCYVNSQLKDGNINIIRRPLVREGVVYEH